MDISKKVLSDITVFSKYAKYNETLGRRETWEELVGRTEAMHLKRFPILAPQIREAFDLVREKKVLPSMRSLQFAGRPIEVNEARVFNCAFAPASEIEIFSEAMFLLLSGCGVGFSVQYQHVNKLPTLKRPKGRRKWVVEDSILGWADAVKILVKSYSKGKSLPAFDFSEIREKGAPLITAGGKAPGPQPLKDCLHNLQKKLDEVVELGGIFAPIHVHDMMCYIANAVLSGGLRRSAMISLFSPTDSEMLTCKSGAWWELNPQRGRANNSVVLERNTTSKPAFMQLWERVKASGSGEPGFYFTNDTDLGINPCAEISLRNYSFCCLTEVNMSDVADQADFEKRCAAASLIGTLQASYTDFHYLRPIWKEVSDEDALIGVGQTGIASTVGLNLDLEAGAEVVKVTNRLVADAIGINPAARTTTVKPSGTTSLVCGTSSGIHAWHSKYYLRSMRFSKTEPIAQYLMQHHPEIVEDEFFSPTTTIVVRVPQVAPEGAVLREEEGPIDLLNRAKMYAERWIVPGHVSGANTNNVSVTASIKADEWETVGEWMWENRHSYNGISVLPFSDHTYKQAPFEEIDEATYNKYVESLKLVDLTKVLEYSDLTNLSGELACMGGSCEIT